MRHRKLFAAVVVGNDWVKVLVAHFMEDGVHYRRRWARERCMPSLHTLLGQPARFRHHRRLQQLDGAQFVVARGHDLAERCQ